MNGGYVRVQQSLTGYAYRGGRRDGIQAFRAGARAWSGAGINLNTDRPSADQVRTAVRSLLRDGQHRSNARALQGNFAQYDALRQVTKTVTSVLNSERHRHTAEITRVAS